MITTRITMIGKEIKISACFLYIILLLLERHGAGMASRGGPCVQTKDSNTQSSKRKRADDFKFRLLALF